MKDFDNENEIIKYSNSFREKLKERYYICKTDIYHKLESNLDGTRKYLIELGDGNLIETVLMIYKNGPSICLSTQVGCRMGCKFCASTVDGLVRNLTPGEIIGQMMKPKPECRRDLGRIARHLCPLHIDMNGRVEERVLTVRPLDGLHDAALTCFLDEEAKGIVHHPPFYTRADGERIHRFELDCVGKRKLAERHGERTNAPLPELCVGKRMRNINPRVCQYMQRLDKLTCCICENLIPSTDAALCVPRYRDRNVSAFTLICLTIRMSRRVSA